ncbi:hypothetical protein PDJAM_G00176380 [Pangasius djambal]|uniref:Uncharacterized protein n=1 Tax=Pangasius djambal TaxID=1691987 RepID=A0ACC5ZNT5_9TELE|nr:hypothetical protein [Pangasius djambal]
MDSTVLRSMEAMQRTDMPSLQQLLHTVTAMVESMQRQIHTLTRSARLQRIASAQWLASAEERTVASHPTKAETNTPTALN